MLGPRVERVRLEVTVNPKKEMEAGVALLTADCRLPAYKLEESDVRLRTNIPSGTPRARTPHTGLIETRDGELPSRRREMLDLRLRSGDRVAAGKQGGGRYFYRHLPVAIPVVRDPPRLLPCRPLS